MELLNVAYEPERAESIQQKLPSIQKQDKNKVIWRRGGDYLPGVLTPEQSKKYKQVYGPILSELNYAA